MQFGNTSSEVGIHFGYNLHVFEAKSGIQLGHISSQSVYTLVIHVLITESGKQFGNISSKSVCSLFIFLAKSVCSLVIFLAKSVYNLVIHLLITKSGIQ